MPGPRLIGVAGLGFLGRGIAKCLLDHGFQVIALDPNAGGLDHERFTLARGAGELADCELVIESITEDFPAKQALFEELERHVSPSAPLVSNTSSIPITLLQAQRKHPNRIAGMHWSAPADATRFLEIIRGEHTGDATIDHIFALAKELDKDPAIVERDIPGFVANRIAYAMYREALHLLEEGVASAEAIDLLCQHSLGLWTSFCGPFRWMDISGGPALYATAMERIIPTLSDESKVPETMQRFQQNNSQGTQNGHGFYAYGPTAAAEWQQKLHEHALKIWGLGLPSGNP